MQNKAGEERNIAIDVDGQELEQVRDFRYLGQIITDDGRCDKEVKRRIAIARSSFINMKDVLATRKLKWDTRMRLVRCYILSTLLYASALAISFVAISWKHSPTSNATHSSVMPRHFTALIANTTTSVSTVRIDTLEFPSMTCLLDVSLFLNQHLPVYMEQDPTHL